ASTIPTISWPSTSGSFGFASSPSRTCRSVRHTPQARTRRSTCPGCGTGFGSSRRSNGRRGSTSTIARMQLLRRRLRAPDGLPTAGAAPHHQHLLAGLVVLVVLAVEGVADGEAVRDHRDVAEHVDRVLQLLERMRARMMHVLLVAAHDRL